MTVSFTADSKGYEKMKAPLKQLKEMLPETGGERYSFTAAKENRNEGFMTSSQVNYVADAAPLPEADTDTREP